MDKNNQTRIIIALIGLVSIFFSVGFPLYYNRSKTNKDNNLVCFQGRVKDGNTGAPIPDAEISFMEKPTITPAYTDSRGVFLFMLEKSDFELPVRIIVKHKKFKPWNNYRKLSQFRIEEIILEPISPIVYNTKPLK